MLFYRAALSLSRKTLNYTAGILILGRVCRFIGLAHLFRYFAYLLA